MLKSGNVLANKTNLTEKQSDWYDNNIEEPIRDLVRILRNNGFNTECSCGHEMYIQCQYIPEGEVKRLHDLIYNYFNGLRDYKIELLLMIKNGHIVLSTLELKL